MTMARDYGTLARPTHEPRRMLRLGLVLFASSGVVVLRLRNNHDTMLRARHGFEVANGTVPGTKLACFDAENVAVYYPADVGAAEWPLISFAPGDFLWRPGWNVQSRYGDLLAGVAAFGFIVAAPMAVGGWCYHAPADQRRVVGIAQEGEHWLWDHVDWSAGVGVLGVSMGGKAALETAALEPQVVAGVSIAPYWDEGRADFDAFRVDVLGDVACPYLLIGGRRDEKSPPWVVDYIFDQLASPRKARLELDNYTHDDLCSSPSTPYVSGIFFACTLRADRAACDILSSLSTWSPPIGEPADARLSESFLV